MDITKDQFKKILQTDKLDIVYHCIGFAGKAPNCCSMGVLKNRAGRVIARMLEYPEYSQLQSTYTLQKGYYWLLDEQGTPTRETA